MQGRSQAMEEQFLSRCPGLCIEWKESFQKGGSGWPKKEHEDILFMLVCQGYVFWIYRSGKGEVMKSNLTTLCYIQQEDRYLMMHRVKKEQDVNKDKWVGIGGHFEPEESPEDCLLREVREETGLELESWRLRGIITFMTDIWQTEYMFLYTAECYKGELAECNEGILEWVPKKQVYELPIWEGDKIFFRLLEEDRGFFSLKLRYQGDTLVEAVLDGRPISCA